MSALRQGLAGRRRQRASATAIRAAGATCASSSPAYLARARGVRADPELVVVCAGFRHGLSLVARALRPAVRAAIAMEDPCARQHRAAAATRACSLSPAAGRRPRRPHRSARRERRRRRALAGAPVPDRRRAASRPARGRDHVGDCDRRPRRRGRLRRRAPLRPPAGRRAAGARAGFRGLRRDGEQDARARACASAGSSCPRGCSTPS